MKIRLFTIPNALTLANLACGCVALVNLFTVCNYRSVLLWILLAAVFDFLDGFAARLLKTSGELGVQLDSLSDMVSFGVVPGAVFYTLLFQSGYPGLAYTGFFITLFSALRLAKFNIDPGQSEEFIGLPTPACAMFIVSGAWFMSGAGVVIPVWALLGITAVFCFLLVCRLRMFALKFKAFGLQGNKLRYGFILLSLVTLGLFGLSYLWTVIGGYIIISITRSLFFK